MNRYEDGQEEIDNNLYEDNIKNIKKEFNRLKKLFTDIEENKYKVVTPLIDKAAFMAVTLDNLQESINRVGTMVEYKNGENQYGTRVNPDVQTYNTMIKNYSSIIKQLIDLLPKGENTVDDGFDKFINDRG